MTPISSSRWTATIRVSPFLICFPLRLGFAAACAVVFAKLSSSPGDPVPSRLARLRLAIFWLKTGFLTPYERALPQLFLRQPTVTTEPRGATILRFLILTPRDAPAQVRTASPFVTSG